MPSKRGVSLSVLELKKKNETYEDTGTALSAGAFTTETLDLAVGVHLVVLKNGHLDLLTLVLDLLGSLGQKKNVRYIVNGL
jgi:hypothetical protein